MFKQLGAEYEGMRRECEQAARKCGLDFYDTEFYVVDFETLNQVIANIGFPIRYSHWRFGMDYERVQKEYGYGMGRVYELVINNNPAIGYLLEYNLAAQQKMVMAHVYAHVDFFKNNMAFSHTNRDMLHTMEEHGRIINRIKREVGYEKAEEFIDACLSLENLIDPHYLGNRPKPEKEEEKKEERKEDMIPEYMKMFMQREKPKEEEKKKDEQKKIPEMPERDVLKFLIEHGDILEGWQKDILSMLRDEAYYFLPQGQTKIMNEGWATFWHNYIMVEMGLAGHQGIVEYSKTMGGVIAKGAGLNPYRLGYMIYNDIRDRWDKGKHGPAYESLTDFEKKKNWDTKEGKGLEKIFHVRQAFDDVEFIRNFLTDDMIRDLMVSEQEEQEDDEEIEKPEPAEVRSKLVNSMMNSGEPVIVVEDGNFMNSKQLVLRHIYAERELDVNFRDRTLARLFDIWKRPVHLITPVEEKDVLFSYDGKSITQQIISKHKDDELVPGNI